MIIKDKNLNGKAVDWAGDLDTLTRYFSEWLDGSVDGNLYGEIDRMVLYAESAYAHHRANYDGNAYY